MILYVNGDSHTMAAEAANNFKVAAEDHLMIHLGNLPHPSNLAVSWGKNLSLALRAGFHCDATIDATPETIINSTKKWLSGTVDTDVLVIIQWPKSNGSYTAIWEFHQELTANNIKHIFFNSSNTLTQSQNDWGVNYIDPYNNSYTSIIKNAKIETVSPISEHFGKDGHSFWNRFLLNHIIKHKFI